MVRRVFNLYVTILFCLLLVMLVMLYRDQHQTELYNNVHYGHDVDDSADEDTRDDVYVETHGESSVDDSQEPRRVADKSWGSIYNRKPRVMCLVPTLWPKKKFALEAIALTWGAHCDKLMFVIDEEVPAPDKLYNGTILKLRFEHSQSTKDRNIWEKVWKMWYHVGKHHLNDADFFFKIDDDSFFSAINFRGFARYYNPDGDWYFGHTLLHTWSFKNVVFNSGTCYGISRGALRKVHPIFETEAFLNDVQRSQSKNFCVHRRGDQEDPTMSICLRSLGINPTNTLDNQFRERFLTFRLTDHLKVEKESTWFWRHKHPRVGAKENCCSDNPVSFHNFKGDAYSQFHELDIMFNVEEGVNGKQFEVPLNANNGTFLFNTDSAPDHDQWLNINNIPKGQRIYKGPGQQRFCYKCDNFKFK